MLLRLVGPSALWDGVGYGTNVELHYKERRV